MGCTKAQPGLTIISCCFLVSFPFIQVHNVSLYHPSVIVTLEEYIWFSLSAALKRSVCSFLIRRTPHLPSPSFPPLLLNWREKERERRGPTAFHSSLSVIRHGVALETYPSKFSKVAPEERNAGAYFGLTVQNQSCHQLAQAPLLLLFPEQALQPIIHSSGCGKIRFLHLWMEERQV